MNSCPLCHDELGVGSDTALVPVSPVVYPGITGLEVHSSCLAAARLGAFERGRARTSRAIESSDESSSDRADARFVQRGATEGSG